MVNLQFPHLILKTLFFNSSVKDRITPYLTPDWFLENQNIKLIVSKIVDYIEKFGKFPNVIESRNMLRSDTSALEELDAALAIPDEEANTEYILDEIQTFIRKKLMYQVSLDVQEWLMSGKNYSEMDGTFSQRMADAESFTFDTEIGLDLMDDLEEIYDALSMSINVIGTGVKEIDNLLNGGVPEKVMIGVLASTNIGKTLIMASIASNMMAAGHNVLYITMEDPDKKIALRMMQNIFSITLDQMKMMNKNSFIALKNRMKEMTKSHLKIVELPDATANCMKLCTVLKDLKEKKNFVPEIIFLDYIGCMIPNGRPNPTLNTNTILQRVAAETRGAICTRMGIPIVTALQTNRGGFDSADVDLNDVADSYGSTMKLDAVLAATQDKTMLENGMYKLKVAKTRLKNNKGTEVMIGVSIDKQQIYDLNTKAQSPSISPIQPAQPVQPQPVQPQESKEEQKQPDNNNSDVADNAYIANAKVNLDRINNIL